MNCEDVFAIAIGLLSFFGLALFVLLGIAFKEDRTIHPIYRNKKFQPSAGRVKNPKAEVH